VTRGSDELRRVYREHLASVYAFFAFSVSESVAEDLTASTFERVIRAWDRYDAEKASERTWILAIAANQLRDHFRRQKHRQAASLDEQPELADALAATEAGFERVLAGSELRAWLGNLSERDQHVLALRYGADAAVAEIARLLELSEANVHQIVSRSLRRLREIATGSVSRSA
jgi:RNA polymerase sigma-70 factor (ECF subfamily)